MTATKGQAMTPPMTDEQLQQAVALAAKRIESPGKEQHDG